MMCRRSALLIVFVCLCCLAAVAQGPVTLQPCTSGQSGGGSALCGKYPVYEDRSARSGRKIDLNIVVLPAEQNPKALDPLFVLAGGPGQAATQLVPIFAGLKGIRRHRDIVFVDQRGTGASNGLACLPQDPGRAIHAILTFRFDNAAACSSDLEADLKLYTTDIAMDDLDELRQAMGYKKINLWGGSYGSRAALVYLRRHPERVRTVTLRGVAPPPLLVPLSFGKGAQRALDAVFEACQEEEACRQAYPGLHEQWQELQRKASQTPTRVSVRSPRGEVEVQVNRDTLASSVLFMLYNSATARLIPSFIASAAEGDWKPLLGFGTTFSTFLGAQLSLGMSLSVMCAEDVAFFDEDKVESSMKGSFLGRAMVDNLWEACRSWPTAAVEDAYHEQVRSEAPVLLLSGEFDPVTPPQWAEDASRQLPNSLHVVMPNTGHVPPHPGCSRSLLEEFIEQGSTEGLDASCVQGMKRPAFLVR